VVLWRLAYVSELISTKLVREHWYQIVKRQEMGMDEIVD
jgi:hypothetical protein